MVAILAETSALAMTLVATAIVPNVRVKTEKIGYRLDNANFCQLRTLLNFFIFFKGLRDTASLNSCGFHATRGD
jgi:hypothetical protein